MQIKNLCKQRGEEVGNGDKVEQGREEDDQTSLPTILFQNLFIVVEEGFDPIRSGRANWINHSTTIKTVPR